MDLSNNEQRTTNNAIRVRFAPSPTGYLHIGSARTALFNWLFAKKNKGTFVLRIEDTDIERSTKEYEQAIIEDLKWLGLDYDEGPCYQSQRFDLYHQKALDLVKEDKAYYCYCSPEELQVEKKKALLEGQPPRYSERCRKITKKEVSQFEAEGRKPAIRFKVEEGFLSINDLIYGKVDFSLDEIADFIILRADGRPTFHLAVVVDDSQMEISHVIRGEDHLSNTTKHVLLFKALGYKAPKFAHIPIILGPDKAKLSKRHGATAVFEYRKEGFLSPAMVNYLSLLSWSPPGEQPDFAAVPAGRQEATPGKEVFAPDELIQLFDLSRVSKSPAIFDLDKLKWLNGQHIRSLSSEALANLIKPYLENESMSTDQKHLILITAAIKDDLITLKEASDYAAVFFEKEVSYPTDVQKYLKEDIAKQAVSNLKMLFSQKAPANFDEAKLLLQEHSVKLKPLGIKGKNAFMPIRLALTGAYSGPELFYLITILDSQEILKRLTKALG